MKISDLIKMGLRNLFRRKARTILTVVGMVIGTISIMIMLSISVGMEQRFSETVKENGALTMIQVSSWAVTTDSDGNYIDSKEQKLNDALVEKLKTLEHVKTVSPSRYFFNGAMYCDKYQCYMGFELVDYDCWELFGYPPLSDGTYPTKADADMLLFGPQVYIDFYYYSGFSYKTKEVDFDKDKVVYVFQEFQPKKGKKRVEIPVTKKVAWLDAPEYSNFQYNCYMDIDYFKQMYGEYVKTLTTTDRKKAMESIDRYDYIILNCDNIDNVIGVQNEIEKLGYKSESEMSQLQPLIESSNMLEMVLAAIGLIAMVVSAINIANTMIMSIYERTKEIGVMKVLGCLVGDIRKLFLFEAGMLGLIGGIIGVGLSYLVSWLLNTYGGALFSFLSFEGAIAEGTKISVIPFWLPILGALFGCVVGVISGFFPSLRATRISAIEAMKTEN